MFAGDKLCEGSVSPRDILRIGGASKVQEFLVNAIQEVYRLQGVAINDKHIEVIVRQMMKKVTVEDAGDTLYLHGDRVNRFEIQNANEDLKKKGVVANSGDSDYEEGDVVYTSNIKDVNNFIPSYSLDERTRSFIKVQDGCDYSCSFCTIPLARGKSRSGTISDLLEIINNIAKSDINEIVLSGINIGDYKDLGNNDSIV